MDIATGLGLVAGAVVVITLMLMGGDLRSFFSDHAVIIIFGGSFSATLIRFPLSSIFYGLPLGAKFAFTLRRMSQRELVDEIAGFAEIARKQGPIGLEKVEIEDPFLAKGVRFVADGPDATLVELEHRKFEQMGAEAGESMRKDVDGGWPGLLELFKTEAEAA